MPIELPSRHFGSDRPVRGLKLPTAGDVPSVRPTPDPGVRVPSPVRSNLENIGAGLSAFGEGVLVAAERQRKEYEATKTAEAELEADRKFGDEFRRRQTEDDTSRPGFMTDFENWLKESTAGTLKAVPQDVRQEAREKLRLRLEGKIVGMRDAAGRLSLDASAKRAQDTIGKMVNQWGAQANRDPDFLGPILDQADERLADFKGALSSDAERDQRTAARQSVIKEALIGLARRDRIRDAETILDSGKYDADLPAEAKASIRAVIEGERKEKLRLAEKGERDAEKRLGLEGDQALKDFYTRIGAGEVPTVADVDALRANPGVKPAEYKGAVESLKKLGSAQDDDKATIARIMPRIHTEDLVTELGNAFMGGMLKDETYRTLMMQNKSALADDRPASPFKSGRSFVSTGLDPGQLGGDAFTRAALTAAQSDALVEYDLWARGNERMTHEQAIEKGREIRARYQNVAFDQMNLALPRPRGYTGFKGDVTIEHVNAAKREIRSLIQTGAMTEATAAREIEQLNTWESVIARQAAVVKPTGKK